MRKGRDGGKREKKKNGGGKKTGKKKEEKRRMKIVATTSLPAVDRPNADCWDAARSRQKDFMACDNSSRAPLLYLRLTII